MNTIETVGKTVTYLLYALPQYADFALLGIPSIACFFQLSAGLLLSFQELMYNSMRAYRINAL